MQGYGNAMRTGGGAWTAAGGMGGLSVIILDGRRQAQNICLDWFQKGVVSFGRSPGNDIVLSSPVVSHEHGRFCFQNGQWCIEDKAAYKGMGSTNGLACNNRPLISRPLNDGDFVRIDNHLEAMTEGVLFLPFWPLPGKQWQKVSVGGRQEIIIGRNRECDIVLPQATVSKFHGRIVREPSGYSIVDHGSTNGIAVNHNRISGKCRLQEKDVIVIADVKMIFTSSVIYYYL